MQKVAIPTDDGRTLSHFGRARTMAVFTIDEGRVAGREDRVNPDPEHLDKAHHKIMMNLVQGCDVVIATHMGPPMVQSLNRVGTTVLVAPSSLVEESLQAYVQFVNGGTALAPLTVEAAEATHGGHGHDHDHHDHAHH